MWRTVVVQLEQLTDSNITRRVKSKKMSARSQNRDDIRPILD